MKISSLGVGLNEKSKLHPIPTGGVFEDFQDNGRTIFIGRIERSMYVVSLLKRVFEDLFGN